MSGRPGGALRARTPGSSRSVTLRPAGPADADVLFELISVEAGAGRLLPRTRDDLAAHASRFTVAVAGPDGEAVVGCAELAPLGNGVGEIRSLVVRPDRRGHGVASALVQALQGRARRAGLRRVSAFTGGPAFFVRLGFRIVPHGMVPEKIALDCRACPAFGRCGQTALLWRVR